MVKIPLQISKDHWSLQVMSKEDHEALQEYGANQIVTAQLTGFKKPRSLQQLRLYWACCNTVAENLEGQTKDDIDFETKIQVAKQHPGLIKRFKSIGGIVYMEPISISYQNMSHLEANRYFDLAFPVMAKMIGVSEQELLQNAESSA